MDTKRQPQVSIFDSYYNLANLVRSSEKKYRISEFSSITITVLGLSQPGSHIARVSASGFKLLDENLRELLLNSTIELDKPLQVLEQFSLIKRIQNSQGVWIHRLIQEAIQNELREHDLEKWWENVANLCLDAFPKETNEIITRFLCRNYQEQVYIPLAKSPQIKLNKVALVVPSSRAVPTA